MNATTPLDRLLSAHPVHQAYGPDSYYIPNFLSVEETKQLFQDMKEHGPWLDRNALYMQFRGRSMRRQTFCCVAGQPAHGEELPAELPKYTYPGQQIESLLHYKTIDTVPGLTALVSRFKDLVSVNHVIGTRYEKGSDTIGYHQDKMLDIQPDTFILIVSFGAEREFTLRKVGEEMPHTSIVVQPGSLFLLGPKTNELHEHSIPTLPEEKNTGERISLVLRHIKTMVKLSEIKKKAAMAPVHRAKRQVQKEEKKKRKIASLIEHDKASEQEREIKRRWRDLIILFASSKNASGTR